MNINESIYMALKVSEYSKVPLLLIGNPGVGKTTTVEYYAELTGKKMILLRGSQSSPEEILGYDVNDDSVYESGSHKGEKMMTTNKLRPTWYLDVLEADEKGTSTLLFLDEITTANEFIQSALLQLIFGRSLDDHNKLPDSCFVVAAGNYANNLSSSFNMIPPLMNRFCIYNVVPSVEDIKIFLSKYSTSGEKDVLKDLSSFDLQNSVIDQWDEGFKTLAKSKVETKLASLVVSFISGKKYDPSLTDMSGVYTDSPLGGDSRLPGFLSLRTVCYFRDMFIGMYLNYGSNGIKSQVFENMTLGLVGVSLAPDKNNSSRYVSLLSDFNAFCKSMTDELDKLAVKSVNRAESQLSSLITKLDKSGKTVKNQRLDSPRLIQVEKVLKTIVSDKAVAKIESPISVEIIKGVADSVALSARSVLNPKKDNLSIDDVASYNKDDNPFLESEDSFNGELKLFNDCIRAFNSLSKVVNRKDFKYDSNTRTFVNNSTYNILKRNYSRVITLRCAMVKKKDIDFTKLVELEELTNEGNN